MFNRIIKSVPIACLAFALCAASGALAQGVGAAPSAQAPEDGIVKVKSAYSMDETIARVKQDLTSKGIMFFMAIDQAKLAADAGIKLRPSTLLVFGNPPLGTLFIKANPVAGLDWPVRMLVIEESDGSIWVAWTDFGFIANRYAIADRAAQFKMASEVAQSIAAAAASR